MKLLWSCFQKEPFFTTVAAATVVKNPDAMRIVSSAINLWILRGIYPVR